MSIRKVDTQIKALPPVVTEQDAQNIARDLGKNVDDDERVAVERLLRSSHFDGNAKTILQDALLRPRGNTARMRALETTRAQISFQILLREKDPHPTETNHANATCADDDSEAQCSAKLSHGLGKDPELDRLAAHYRRLSAELQAID